MSGHTAENRVEVFIEVSAREGRPCTWIVISRLQGPTPYSSLNIITSSNAIPRSAIVTAEVEENFDLKNVKALAVALTSFFIRIG